MQIYIYIYVCAASQTITYTDTHTQTHTYTQLDFGVVIHTAGVGALCVADLRQSINMTHMYLQTPARVRCDSRSLLTPASQSPVHSLSRLRRPSADGDRPAVLCRWTAVQSPVVAETLAPVSLTQTQESVEVLKRTKLITAIKTPYREDGKFDLRAYDSHVSRQIENGVEGLIVGGTTGESSSSHCCNLLIQLCNLAPLHMVYLVPSLYATPLCNAGEGQLMSWDEHVMLIAHTVNSFGSQLQVIGNTGSNSTREALHATEQGFAVGMDAALQINPYYGKTSLDGLMAHFTAVLHEGPTIIYNVPSRTGRTTCVYTNSHTTTHVLGSADGIYALRLHNSEQVS